MAILAIAMLILVISSYLGYYLVDLSKWIFLFLFAIAFVGPYLRSKLVPPPKGSNFVKRMFGAKNQLPFWANATHTVVVLLCVVTVMSLTQTTQAMTALSTAQIPYLVFFVFYFTEALQLFFARSE